MINFDIITKAINITGSGIICQIAPKYVPLMNIHILGYVYGENMPIQLTITTNGDLAVYGNHNLSNKRVYISCTYFI